MAEIVFIEIDENNIIVGVHSDELDSKYLDSNHSMVEKTVEEPQSLVGLSDTYIDEPPSKRPKIGVVSEINQLRLELKALSIELDLQTRMSEDTTVTQADFDAKKALYEGLVSPPP